MNAKQRNSNRETAMALHFAIQSPIPRFGQVLCKPYHVGKTAKKRAQREAQRAR